MDHCVFLCTILKQITHNQLFAKAGWYKNSSGCSFQAAGPLYRTWSWPPHPDEFNLHPHQFAFVRDPCSLMHPQIVHTFLPCLCEEPITTSSCWGKYTHHPKVSHLYLWLLLYASLLPPCIEQFSPYVKQYKPSLCCKWRGRLCSLTAYQLREE